MIEAPLVSCLCITFKRSERLKRAITLFNEQTLENRELVIVYESSDTATKAIADAYEGCPRILYSEGDDLEQKVAELNNVSSPSASHPPIKFVELSLAETKPLGWKRNLGVLFCAGSYFATWDDDDWYANDRLERQLEAIKATDFSACTLARMLLYLETEDAVYRTFARDVGWEGTMLCRKDANFTYKDLNKREDTDALEKLHGEGGLKVIDSSELYIYQIHGKNTWDMGHFKTLIEYSESIDGKEADSIRAVLEAP